MDILLVWAKSYSQLLRDPRVLFAGYRVPHPLEYHFLLRIQVKEGYTPQDVLSTAIQDCISTVAHMQNEFKVCLVVHRGTTRLCKISTSSALCHGILCCNRYARVYYFVNEGYSTIYKYSFFFVADIYLHSKQSFMSGFA